jgi:tetratricopeptide (TPR) repeat protein
VAALFAFAACAPRTGLSPFIKKGPGLIDVGGVEGESPEISRAAIDRAVRDAQSKRDSKVASDGQLLEGRDVRLRSALATLTTSRNEATLLLVAREYERLGVNDMAYDYFTAALRVNHKSAPALDGRARLLRDAGLIGAALVDAHRARYFAPLSPSVHHTLGTILEHGGWCGAALNAYREADRLTRAKGGDDSLRHMSSRCSAQLMNER